MEVYPRPPHTSAVRIPTQQGYRFFVDHLGQPAARRRTDAQRLRSFFESTQGELEQMLDDTSRLRGDLTTYAGVVVGPAAAEATVRSVQVVGLTPSMALAVLVLSSGSVEKHTLDLSAAAALAGR